MSVKNLYWEQHACSCVLGGARGASNGLQRAILASETAYWAAELSLNRKRFEQVVRLGLKPHGMIAAAAA